MQSIETARPRAYGPWLVALGAGLWGTESAWRIPLNDVFAADVIVFYEHVILVLCFAPVIYYYGLQRRQLGRISASTLGYLLFSGVAGSAVGTVLFTMALQRGNPSVVNVILNIQPVLSTAGAYLLFRDRLSPQFFLWGALAIAAGAVLSVEPDAPGSLSLAGAGGVFRSGTALALLCALFWGLSTVAGRGVMLHMGLPLACGLRVVVGLLSMAIILLVRGKFQAQWLWPAAAQAARGRALAFLFLLATLSGGVPLLIYFQGLKLTRASTAGYFEMMQTLTAVVITWGFFGHRLAPQQVAAGAVLCTAVALLQRAQERVALA